MLAGHSVPTHYTPSRSDSLTRYRREGGQCYPATQHPRTTLHLGRIHLLATATKEGSISRPLSTQALHYISIGFTYSLQQQIRPVSRLLSTHALHSISIGFTYSLQQRRRAVSASHSAPRNYTSSRSDSLTPYSSKGGQCQPTTRHPGTIPLSVQTLENWSHALACRPNQI